MWIESVAFRHLRLACRALVCVPVLVALSASPLTAQSLGAGAIEGLVTDESRAAMPGVTVTAVSPALQVASVTTVTEADGWGARCPGSIRSACTPS